jgi:hypothetical protein
VKTLSRLQETSQRTDSDAVAPSMLLGAGSSRIAIPKRLGGAAGARI